MARLDQVVLAAVLVLVLYSSLAGEQLHGEAGLESQLSSTMLLSASPALVLPVLQLQLAASCFGATKLMSSSPVCAVDTSPDAKTNVDAASVKPKSRRDLLLAVAPHGFGGPPSSEAGVWNLGHQMHCFPGRCAA
jgi:hypothetical protein